MRTWTIAATRPALTTQQPRWLVLLALLAVACDATEPGTTAGATASPTGGSAVAEIFERTGADELPVANPREEADRRLATAPICTAQPTPWHPATFTLEPGVLHSECRLQTVQTDSNNDGVVDGTLTYGYGPQQVTVHHKGGGQTYVFDDQGRVIKRVITHTNTGYVHTDTRTFDATGHLVMNEIRHGKPPADSTGGAKVGKVYIYRVEQVWEGDLLLERREWQNKHGPTKRTSWRYDSAGRMVEAARRIGSSEVIVARATWTYDPAGRPTRLDREIHGKPAMSASWQWSAERRLLRRSVQVWLGVGAVSGGRLDSYDAPTGSNNGACYGCGYSGGGPGKNAWSDALLQLKDGCATLPVAVGHGYPEADYALVDEADLARSQRLGGYSVYGIYGGYYGGTYGGYYGYGGSSFVGHGGVGVNWDALAVAAPHASARFEIQYDAQGRMISEALQVTQSKPTPQLPTKLLRQRVFGPQGLTTDAVLHNTTTLRALQMQRDDAGRLTARSLWVGGQLAELDTWQRDAQGRPVQQRRFSQKQPWKTLAPTAQAQPMPAPVLTSRVLQTRDSAGRPLQVRAKMANDPSNEVLETLAYDDQGRTVSYARGTTEGGVQLQQQWAFDAEGRETLHTWKYPKLSSSSDRFEAATYNGAGLRILKEHGKRLQDGPTWREVRSYHCE